MLQKMSRGACDIVCIRMVWAEIDVHITAFWLESMHLERVYCCF
jgi:hypothetical protein